MFVRRIAPNVSLLGACVDIIGWRVHEHWLWRLDAFEN
jgi:hypothetical protein